MRQEVELREAEVRAVGQPGAGKGAWVMAGAGISRHIVLLFGSVAAWWGIEDVTGRGRASLIVAAIRLIVARSSG